MTDLFQIRQNLLNLTDHEKLQYIEALVNSLQHTHAVIQSKMAGEFLEIVDGSK